MPVIDPEKMDINALLSIVEDIIKQQNSVDHEFYSDKSKNNMAISLVSVNLQGMLKSNPLEKYAIF